MEYPMATLITGERNFGSLVGVSVHELMHSWYQGVLATNEALYAWMDEGFTSWTSAEVMNHLKKEKLIRGEVADNPHLRSIAGYKNFMSSGKQEALITHADHFNTNYAYWLTAYTCGQTFLEQLGYIMGADLQERVLRRYYHTWQFKHPNTNDFIRIAEKESGMELDWYKEYFVNSTKTIDYAIEDVKAEGKRTSVTLSRKGKFPMPIDLKVTFENGSTKMYTIPLGIMRGAKTSENGESYIVLKDWYWTHPTYEANIEGKVKSVEIDPSGRMADMDLENNTYGIPKKDIKD